MVFYGGQWDSGGYGAGGGQYANAVLGSFDYTPENVEPVPTATLNMPQSTQSISPFNGGGPTEAQQWVGIGLQAAGAIAGANSGSYTSGDTGGSGGGGFGGTSAGAGDAGSGSPSSGYDSGMARVETDTPTAHLGGSQRSSSMDTFNRDISGQRSQQIQQSQAQEQAQVGIQKMNAQRLQGQTVAGVSPYADPNDETNVVGGVGGAVAGASTGAQIGGTLTLGNPIGIAAGAIIGGAAGWFAGS